MNRNFFFKISNQDIGESAWIIDEESVSRAVNLHKCACPLNWKLLFVSRKTKVSSLEIWVSSCKTRFSSREVVTCFSAVQSVIPPLCLVFCTVILDLSCTGNFFANNQPNSVALKNTRFILDWFTEISVRIHYLIMMNKWSKLKFDNTYLTNSKWSLSFYKKWRYSTCNLGLCIEEYDFLYQFIGHAILILNFVPSTCLIGSWTKDIENLTHTRIIKNVRQHLIIKQKRGLAVSIVNRFIRQL